MSSAILLLTLAFICVCFTPAHPLGIPCTDHPAYEPRIKPVLIQAWEFVNHARLHNIRPSMYHPMYTSHTYAPYNNLGSKQFDGLDFFWFSAGEGSGQQYIRLVFQRPAKVYLFLRLRYDSRGRPPPLSLTGWRSETYAELVKGNNRPFTYGVHHRESRTLASKVHVFSRVVTDEVFLPHPSWIKENLSGRLAREAPGDYTVMVAERDGSAPKLPARPAGFRSDIRPETRCPDALHNLWTVDDDDPNDPDTRGQKWLTWHPQWDPCYWCAYDHEHGSSAYHIMGYKPKFHYTAWKNNRQDESNEGFKGHAFRYGDHFIYYNLHAQTSSLRRVTTRTHTINLVIVNARTKEVEVDIAQKGDFGFVAARKAGGGLFPLRPVDSREEARQAVTRSSRGFRTLNIININNLDPRFSYRQDSILIGEYEGWTSGSICSISQVHREISVDIRNAITGVRTLQSLDTPLFLGRPPFRSTGQNREIRFSNFVVSDEHCLFSIDKIEEGAVRRDGYFYTDADGVVLKKGPSKFSVRQYVKPGFRLEINGVFQTKDHWIGLHGPFPLDVSSSMQNPGFGLDPERN